MSNESQGLVSGTTLMMHLTFVCTDLNLAHHKTVWHLLSGKFESVQALLLDQRLILFARDTVHVAVDMQE